MKHNKLIATIAAAGSFFALTGAAHAISPAAAIGLAAISGAAVGSVAAQSAQPPAVAVVPGNSTVVMGGPPATTVQVTPAPAPLEVQTTTSSDSSVWLTPSGPINYDHDGDGVLNANDRFPNDGTRS